jgi:folate-binding protein YgfZ
MNFPLDQYNALLAGRGFVELPAWSSVTLTGADRRKFLNSFCTNDVSRLSPGESCEAFITNVKGKLLGHGLVDCREQELVFITVPQQAPALIEHLDRYIIREDVQLRDTTAEKAYFFCGPILAANSEPSARWIGWKLLGPDSGGLVEVATADAATLRQSLTDRQLERCGMAAFDVLRVEAGTPLFGVDFDASNLPQEVARNDRAISFTKGCYLGQETVARIDALGHVNQELTGVRFEGAEVPAAASELTHEGSVAGRITTATYSPRLDAPLALAMVRREWLAPGTRLESRVGPCEVIKLPVGA